jgi:FlaA1/EpsC-like NDP-sugar epimerase
MPRATTARLREIARLTAEVGIPSDTIPALDQLVAGRVKLAQLRPVQIEDLLRRSPVLLDHTGIRNLIRDQVVVVTGAGGSIGAELCRQILNQAPRLLLLIDRSEVQLFQIEQELIERGASGVVVPLVADVVDAVRIRKILRSHRPDVLFHAAAHKHVPMMESQPGEAIRNNSLGTANLARLAHECGVGRFVFISTDKAINPTNVMGASKRLAEIFLQSFSAANPNPTQFMAVRFGNVLGSSGSVVPVFQKQIASGGPITVTHPEVTRYFMTIPEAVGLVLQAGTLGQGGEIFVLDMGEPVKILDLATQMIELSGYRAGQDIEIQFSGLRPGEKLFEELSHHKERLTETGHPKILRFICQPPDLSQVELFLSELQLQLNNAEPSEIKRSIQRFVPEYRPYIQ